MKVSRKNAGGMAAVGAALLVVAGCSGRPSRVYPDAVASDAPQKAMDLYDTDKDGFIDGAELDKVPGLKAALKQVDTNGDGKIDAEEAKDPQNKAMMERLFSGLGKEPHYPVVIAEMKRDLEANYRKQAASATADPPNPGSASQRPARSADGK